MWRWRGLVWEIAIGVSMIERERQFTIGRGLNLLLVGYTWICPHGVITFLKCFQLERINSLRTQGSCGIDGGGSARGQQGSGDGEQRQDAHGCDDGDGVVLRGVDQLVFGEATGE